MKNKNDQTLKTNLDELQERIKNQKHIISAQLHNYKEIILISVAPGQEGVNPFQKTENELLLRQVSQQLNQYAKIALDNQEELIKTEKETRTSTPSSSEKIVRSHLEQLEFNLHVMKKTFDDCQKNNTDAFEVLDNLTSKYNKAKARFDREVSRSTPIATSVAELGHTPLFFKHTTPLDADRQLSNAGIGRQF